MGPNAGLIRERRKARKSSCGETYHVHVIADDLTFKCHCIY